MCTNQNFLLNYTTILIKNFSDVHCTDPNLARKLLKLTIKSVEVAFAEIKSKVKYLYLKKTHFLQTKRERTEKP